MIRYLFLATIAFVECSLVPLLPAQESREAQDPPRGRAPSEEGRERWDRWREASEPDAQPVTEEAPAESAPESYIDQLQFRSILSLDGSTRFSLHNPYDGRTFWVSAEGSRHGVEVVEFDADRNALTIRHEEETRTLPLQAARVTDLKDSDTRHDRRRQMWEARQAEFQRLHEKWNEAVEESPELQEIHGRFRELGSQFRENRRAIREAEPGSDEHRRLEAQQREMREEFRLMSEYAAMELRRNEAFSGEEVDSMERMIRMMAFQRREGEDPGSFRGPPREERGRRGGERRSNGQDH